MRCVLLSQSLLAHKNHSVVPPHFHQCLTPGSSPPAWVFGVPTNAAVGETGGHMQGLCTQGSRMGSALSKQRALECPQLRD